MAGGDKGLRRTDEQKERDKAIVSDLMLKSYPTREIAKHLNQITVADGYKVSHITVHKDAKKILEEWREQRSEMITNLVDREIAKLDMMEFEAWQAWEKSKGGRSRTKVRGGRIQNGQLVSSDPGSAERIMENTQGDPRYMMIILQCMDKRRELLGYGAAKRVEHSGSVSISTVQLDEDGIKKEKERMLANLLKKQGINYD